MQLFIKNYNEINFKNCYVEFNSVTFWVTNKAQSTCAVLLLVRHELKKNSCKTGIIRLSLLLEPLIK